jgi:hypothetical protein
MLDVDEPRQPAPFLRLGNRCEGECCLSRALRAKNLDHAPAWKTPNPKRAIDQDIPSGNDLNCRYRCIAKPANCFAAVVLFNLLDGQIEVFCANGGGLFVNGGGGIFSLRHSL